MIPNDSNCNADTVETSKIDHHLQILPETVIEEVSVNIGSDNDNPATATYQSRYKVLQMLCDALNKSEFS